jgi:hypothetical protein
LRVISDPRIFVQIASYRDPDCQWTIKDLFEKAAHPERIFVGVTWQFIPSEDEHCFREPYPFPGQVRVQEFDARQSKGACWARSMVQKLWCGEEFTLQIDSHMRFEPGWDEILFSIWKACENEKAVITGYMPGFAPPDSLERGWIFGMSASEFDEDGILLFAGAPAWPTGGGEPARPVRGAFVSANMLFGPASILADVPYDPDLYFFGEEVSLAVRLWTHGYDIYHPNRLVMFHNWKRDGRRTHFDDHDKWFHRHAHSAGRVRQLLGVGKRGRSLDEIESYGLGPVRSLEQYELFSGVDFAEMLIAARASECSFA